MAYSGGGDITNGTHTHDLCHECHKAGDENARLQSELKTARACDSDALMVSECADLQADVKKWRTWAGEIQQTMFRYKTRMEEAERRSHKGGWVCDCDCHEEIDGLEGADYKAQRQAEDAVGYEEEAARYDVEQAQQEADHRRDVARDEEIVTEEPGPSRPKR
ncbi:hypothetical protein LCGC14_2549570 [marine sediment metagenome]|uniref:Uncharacterized protein n=1 Tax=marine sediment metagenome TaxID=412755 RepID=A0A0F9BB49_9ZZZZ